MKVAVLDIFRTITNGHRFELSDLFAGRGGKGRKVAAKYANPDNPAETWSGRGRKPRWLAGRLKAGDRIDKFLIE